MLHDRARSIKTEHRVDTVTQIGRETRFLKHAARKIGTRGILRDVREVCLKFSQSSSCNHFLITPSLAIVFSILSGERSLFAIYHVVSQVFKYFLFIYLNRNYDLWQMRDSIL